jgi:hypothetical protein
MTLRPSPATGRLARHLIAASVLILACSCTDVTAVQHFAEESQKVGEQFQPLADDGFNSCQRATTFLLPGNPAPDCNFFPSIEPSLLAINHALFAYIASLGKLASVNTGNTAASLQNLGSDLKRADPGISDANLGKANASLSLAGALVNVLASGYQQKKLAEIIGKANDPVQQVTSFMDEYAAFRYAQQFKDEQSREKAYCVQYTDQSVPEVAKEPIAVGLLSRACKADFQKQADRLAAVQKYQEALRAIASAHQKLYDERHRWNTKQLATDLLPATKELSDAADAMNKAF